MKIALAGLPQSGKTTIFTALTGQKAAAGAMRGKPGETNTAIVKVDDPRVENLSRIYTPEKTVFATVEVTDCAGMSGGENKADLDEAMLKVMKNCHALGIVVRNFTCALRGAPTPAADFGRITETLVFSDLLLADTRLQRMAAMEKKGQKIPQAQTERPALERVRAHLEAGAPLRTLALSAAEQAALQHLQFLTDKPTMIILNSGEDNFGKSAGAFAAIDDSCPVVECAGAFEMELSQLHDAAEAQAFMADMGIAASARERLTRTAYELLGYISFFTVGPDEVRAWNLRRGATALDAAAAIHSDLARGFIRAECFHYDDLMELGSEKVIKERGRLRLEGKTYTVADGDILNIRFNV